MNTAERLGFHSGERLLIVHADDLGMCHSLNMASIQAFQAGVVTSGSIMVPCPWFPEIAAHARDNPDLDLGLHLTLTCERKYYRWRPVAPANKVQGLFDQEGYLWPSERQTAGRATAGEVETELRAQIERALAFGISPTHLDNHAGVPYTRKDYFEIYMQLGAEYGVPLLIARPTPELEQFMRTSGLAVSAERLRQAESEGFLLIDRLVTSASVAGKTAAERKRAYHELLRDLKPGLNQIIIHLGMNDPELRAITTLADQWYADFLAFTDPETKELIGDLGIRLTNWRELSEMAASQTAAQVGSHA